MRNRCFVSVVVFCVLVLGASAQAGKDLAVTYQINAHHNGAITTPALIPPLRVKWSVNMRATVSYPLIAENKVFVIAGPDASKKVNLYALDAQTGHRLWGPVLIPEGVGYWAAAAYDNGVIYVVPYTAPGSSNNGTMYAFNAQNGHAIWNVSLPGQYLFTSPPTALNGVVYTGGAGTGGTVYAVRETDGNVMWTGSVANGDNSSPVVTMSAVYVSYVCPQSYKFAAKTGNLIWHYSGGCEGGGGATPVLYNGLLYVRDWSKSNGHDGDILHALNGTYVGFFDADFAPAFFDETALYVQSGNLNAVDTITGATVWTAVPTGGDSFSTPPIVVNGVVYVGTYLGKLLGYRAKTGVKVVTKNMRYSISANETDSLGPESGLGAGQGILVVPASTHLIALSH